jgi:hypothetical protein
MNPASHLNTNSTLFSVYHIYLLALMKTCYYLFCRSTYAVIIADAAPPAFAFVISPTQDQNAAACLFAEDQKISAY